MRLANDKLYKHLTVEVPGAINQPRLVPFKVVSRHYSNGGREMVRGMKERLRSPDEIDGRARQCRARSLARRTLVGLAAGFMVLARVFQ